MKRRDFVRRYLFTERWRHRLDRLPKQALCCGDADNLEVSAILIMTKRFNEEVFRSAFEPTSASANYRDDADSETTESDDGFQGVDLEVADQTSGTYLMANGEN